MHAWLHVHLPAPPRAACRNAENNTQKYPDIVARLPGLLQPHVKSIVIDSEAVAWDPVAKKIQPFQVNHRINTMIGTLIYSPIGMHSHVPSCRPQRRDLPGPWMWHAAHACMM